MLISRLLVKQATNCKDSKSTDLGREALCSSFSISLFLQSFHHGWCKCRKVLFQQRSFFEQAEISKMAWWTLFLTRSAAALAIHYPLTKNKFRSGSNCWDDSPSYSRLPLIEIRYKCELTSGAVRALERYCTNSFAPLQLLGAQLWQKYL